MAEIQWWYARGAQQLGPVAAAELRRLASTGALSPGDLVWREGLPEWTPAARLKGLFSEAALREAAAYEAAAREAAPAPPAEEPPPAPSAATAVKETAEMPSSASGDAGFASFVVNDAVGEISAADILPDTGPAQAPPAAATAAPGPAVSEGPRMTVSHLKLVLMLVQGVLWGTCVLVILLGGLLFTSARLRAKSPADEAASAAVFATFFIGAYVVARAGEKIAGLVQAYAERRSRP